VVWSPQRGWLLLIVRAAAAAGAGVLLVAGLRLPPLRDGAHPHAVREIPSGSPTAEELNGIRDQGQPATTTPPPHSLDTQAPALPHATSESSRPARSATTRTPASTYRPTSTTPPPYVPPGTTTVPPPPPPTPSPIPETSQPPAPSEEDDTTSGTG
jgi:hypothetical protein